MISRLVFHVPDIQCFLVYKCFVYCMVCVMYNKVPNPAIISLHILMVGKSNDTQIIKGFQINNCLILVAYP